MRGTPSFLRDEAGAVAVDYVVLAAGATGLALLVATGWGETFSQASEAMSDEAASQGIRDGSWESGIENYPPHNPVLYERLVYDFASLSDADLDEMERFVNAYDDAFRPFLDDNESNIGLLDDLDFALELSYVRRERVRPQSETVPNFGAVGRIANDLGWDEGIVAAAYEGSQAAPPIEELENLGVPVLSAFNPGG